MKSLLVAYLLWVVGGWCCLHLLYLRRDKQAFVYWWSFGGYFGCGVLRDFFRLPAYVKHYNDDPEFVEELTDKMRRKSKPGLSISRMVAQMMVGNLWYLLVYAAVPKEPLFGGLHLQPLAVLVAPMASAVAVWLIGNIGQECGKLRWALIGSYSVLVAVPALGEQVLNWCCVLSMLFFNKCGKKWRRTREPKVTVCRRVSTLLVSSLLLSSCLCSFLYFNAELESNGEKVKFRDAVGNFIRSPMFQEFKENIKKVYNDTWTQGFGPAWTNFIELMDPTGSIHAFKVLELPKNATQTEIKERIRDLSKQWHPDKHKGEEEKQTAQEKFMLIQKAGDILLDSKRRRIKNSKMRKHE